MLPWYLRKVAAAVYGEPPTSSIDEALSFAMKVRYHCFFLLKFIALKIESNASNFNKRFPDILGSFLYTQTEVTIFKLLLSRILDAIQVILFCL